MKLSRMLWTRTGSFHRDATGSGRRICGGKRREETRRLILLRASGVRGGRQAGLRILVRHLSRPWSAWNRRAADQIQWFKARAADRADRPAARGDEAFRAQGRDDHAFFPQDGN